MPVTDTIADFLTRIRNAGQAKHKTVDIPCSKLKLALAAILKDQGFVADFEKVGVKKKEAMTHMDRTLAAMADKKVDRLPVYPLACGVLAQMMRIPSSCIALPKSVKPSPAVTFGVLR